jgi:hypothetical protein
MIGKKEEEIAHVRARLKSLEAERAELEGKLGKLQRQPGICEDQERLILATGRYIEEGFDDQRLDTLFLTMPISWKGILAQYVGRLHRQHTGKTEVLVVDYVDEGVPMLSRMAAKRRTGYRTLGYEIE